MEAPQPTTAPSSQVAWRPRRLQIIINITNIDITITTPPTHWLATLVGNEARKLAANITKGTVATRDAPWTEGLKTISSLKFILSPPSNDSSSSST